MSGTMRRRPIADQARDLYIAARRTHGINDAITAVAVRLGLSHAEVGTLLGFSSGTPATPAPPAKPPKEAT